MDQVVTFAVRLGLGVFLAAITGLLGMALATFVIPPAYSGRGPYLVVRIVMIGAGSGIGGALVWSPWRDLPRDTFVTLSLALLGGVGGALGSYASADPQFDGLGSVDKALASSRATVLSAVAGANLLPALYSSLVSLRVLMRKSF